MDLIMLHTAPEKHRELCAKTALALVDRHLPHDTLIQIDVPLPWPAMLITALRQAVKQVSTEWFILTQDTTMVLEPYDPTIARCHEKSNYLRRKGVQTEAMGNTIRHCLEHNLTTYDYEIQVPQAYNTQAFRMALDNIPSDGETYHIRSMYFNALCLTPERTADPVVEQWVWNKWPNGGVVSLTEYSLTHPDCISWLKSFHAAPVQA